MAPLASHLRHRLARPGLPLVPRHRGDRLDRDVVLLRRARQPPAASPSARRTGAEGVSGESWEIHGGGFYRIQQVPGRAADASEAAALVQVGGLLDVALGLRAPLRPLLRGRAPAADRPVGRRPRAVAGDPDLDRAARRRVARLRRALPRARRPASSLLAARDPRPRHRDRVRRRAALRAARRVPPGRRDARDDHGRERPLRDHPRPLGARAREGGGPRARPEAADRRGKQRSVHNNYLTLPVLFTMLAGHFSFTYTPRPRLGGARRADGRRRRDPPLLQQAPRGRDALVDPGRLRLRDRGDRGLAPAARPTPASRAGPP